METASHFVVQQKRSDFWFDYSSFPDGTPQEEMDAWVAVSQHVPNWPDSPEYADHEYRLIRRTDEVIKEYPSPAQTD